MIFKSNAILYCKSELHKISENLDIWSKKVFPSGRTASDEDAKHIAARAAERQQKEPAPDHASATTAEAQDAPDSNSPEHHCSAQLRLRRARDPPVGRTQRSAWGGERREAGGERKGEPDIAGKHRGQVWEAGRSRQRDASSGKAKWRRRWQGRRWRLTRPRPQHPGTHSARTPGKASVHTAKRAAASYTQGTEAQAGRQGEESGSGACHVVRTTRCGQATS